jgi:rare lipoprotein A (peptidoglycan hydrolase)
VDAPEMSGGAKVPSDVRRPKVVASLALIAVLASVAVPRPAGPTVPSPIGTPSADLSTAVEMVAFVRGPVTTTEPLDPGARSDGILDHRSRLFEPDTANGPPQARPAAAQPEAKVVAVSKNRWRMDRNVSWYGPGFYGKRTACGLAMTRTLVGVAHRTLPCGTRITFRNPANGRTVTAPVVDRGPYVRGRQWDLTGGLCKRLDHCYTGALSWKYAGG